MPNYISDNGSWKPAHERTFDPKLGEIYDGPDRAAKSFIESEGGKVGQDATKDPQLLQAARNMGFPTVEEYLNYFKPTDKQVEEKKIADEKIIDHKLQEPKPGVEPTLGGFHDDSETPDQVLEQKRRGRPRKV